MGTCKIEEWVIGSDKKPTINLYDNTGDAITLADITGYGIRVYDSKGAIMGSYGVNLSGFTDTQIVNVGTSSFDVVLDKAINTVEGIVTGRIFALWVDSDFTDTDFDEIGYSVNLYNSVSE